MPCIRLKDGSHISFIGDYKPGDPPPSGYVDWHAWAEVQDKAGLKPNRCGVCSLWKFPQELSGAVWRSTPVDRFGNEIEVLAPICLACHAKDEARAALQERGYSE